MAKKEELSREQVEAMLQELERKLSRLRSLYEQYFLGIERRPPTTARKDVFRLIQKIEQLHIRNTAQQFRARSLVQRFNSYRNYWSRTERQIEEGTYHRQVQRSKSRQEIFTGGGASPGEDGVFELDLELEAVDLESFQAELEELESVGAFDSKPNEPGMPQDAAGMEDRRQQKLREIQAALGISQSSTPDTSTPAQGDSGPRGAGEDRLRKLHAMKQRLQDRSAQPSSRTIQRNAPSGMHPRVVKKDSDDQAQRVYNELVEAKRRCNEPVTGLSYESVSRSMNQQRDQLKRTHGAKDVEFKVVIKDGRAFLKPVPK